MQILRHETRPRALDLMRPRLQWLTSQSLRNYRGIFRLHGDRRKGGFPRFNHLVTTRYRATCSDRRNEDIYFSIRVGPNLLRRRLAMNFRIRRVVKLLRDPRVRGLTR